MDEPLNPFGGDDGKWLPAMCLSTTHTRIGMHASVVCTLRPTAGRLNRTCFQCTCESVKIMRALCVCVCVSGKTNIDVSRQARESHFKRNVICCDLYAYVICKTYTPSGKRVVHTVPGLRFFCSLRSICTSRVWR